MNFNPSILFDGIDDYISGLSGYYSHDVYVVIDPTTPYTSTSTAGYIL